VETCLLNNLRDGSWCHMPPAQAELAVLFGLDAATPFNWTPTGTVQSPDDPGCSKFFWGPLQLQLDFTNSNGTQMLPQQSPPPYGVRDKIASRTAGTRFLSNTKV
jgi:hypothetical protein